jgi:PqqD family protein of HPr-rel-A system
MQRLRSLAINPDGFAFDPTTGESYTLNATGLAILEALRDGRPYESLPDVLAERFGVGRDEARRDVDDFVDQLRAFRLLAS